MKLLAIDTSTSMISCAAIDGDKRIFRLRRMKPRGSSTLIGQIKKMIDKHDVTLDDFDAFIVGAGPGSFTGLRIAYSIVKGFRAALGKPVIALSSFLSMVKQVESQYDQVAVVSDARRGLFYGAAYRVKNKKIIRVTKEGLYSPKDFIASHRQYTFITCDEHIQKLLIDHRGIGVHKRCLWPDALSLIEIARPLYNKKKYRLNSKLEPLYLYPKDCQIKSST